MTSSFGVNMETASTKTAPASRWDRPRIILWLGSRLTVEPSLLEDLPRLPLVGVFLETQDAGVEAALRAQRPISARYPVGLSTAEEVAAWDPSTLPIFYLRGREGVATSPLRDEHRRSAMLDRFAVLAEDHRPSVVALGMDGDDREFQTLLAVAAEYGALTPVVVVGDAPALQTALERIRAAQIPLAEPEILAGGWTSKHSSMA